MPRWTREQLNEWALKHNASQFTGTMIEESASRRQRLGPSRAKRTPVDGIVFPSKAEARLYEKLIAVARSEGARLYRQVRFPLLNLASVERLKAMAFTIDFVLVHRDNKREFFDAKARWKNREWARGKAAFEAEYNAKVQEIQS